MIIIQYFLNLWNNLNNQVQDIIVGAYSSVLTIHIGEVITGENYIIGNNLFDTIIKITIPIITGVLVPLVSNYISERKKRK